jgi:hypothetical protein
LKLLPATLCAAVACLIAGETLSPAAESRNGPERKLLYVATPGIRDYLEYGGHGILVFDIAAGHKFVKRIPSAGLDEKGKPLNVKGICASAKTGRLYLTTTRTLLCFDLISEKLLWEKSYGGGCDRLAISPDGKIIYLPSLEKEHWHVVDALSGEVIKKIVTNSGAHNTIVGLDGRYAYLAGLKSPLLRVADARKHEVLREIGPFSNMVRPFTVNGRQTLCYVNVNELLGFEIGDLENSKVLHHVEVQGFEKGTVKRHGCPSHGIALTHDEKESGCATRLTSVCTSSTTRCRRRNKWRASPCGTSPAGSRSALMAVTPILRRVMSLRSRRARRSAA